MTLRLAVRYTGSVPVEAECVAPDRFAILSATEIGNLEVQCGNTSARLGDFFTIEGDASDAHIVIQGDCSRIKWLGTRMTGGRLTIDGDAGTHLGSEMRGGEIEVRGSSDDWCGAEMRGGLIRIRGSAGHHTGSAYPGSRRGMRGGELIIQGDAGNELGAVMRRGLIAVGGRCGTFAGSGMVAGSIFAFGPISRYPGAGMKRGTIAAFFPGFELLPTFRLDCDYRPGFIELYLRRLQSLGFPVPQWGESLFRRYRGDLAALGLGEMLIRSG